MTIHADQRFINGLLENNTLVVKEIYDRYSAKINHHILQNNGSEDDAADIFQESIMDIYHQAKHKQLQLTCPFEPFLLLICKRKWLNELKKRGRRPVTKSDIDVSHVGEDVFTAAERLVEDEQRTGILLLHFEKLGEKCKEILRYTMSSTSQEKIAEKLGLSYGYLRKKKSECLSTLLNYVKNN